MDWNGVEILTFTVNDSHDRATASDEVSVIISPVNDVPILIEIGSQVTNEDESLKPGMFLLVELGVDERADAVLIPEQAVVSDGTSSYVYVVVDGEAIRRPIVVGERMPGEVEIMEGVTSGEAVIIGGVQKVRDGAKVKPRQMEQASSTG